MAIKIKSTKDVTAEGANIVIYGESGVGKTTLVSHLENAIILSAEQGLLSLSKFDIPYIEITDIQDVDDAYEYCKKSDYEHIVFDSLTEIAEVVLYEMKEGKKDKRQAYGELADAFGVAIRKFRDIKGKNTIFFAKMKHIYDDEGTVVAYAPLMPGRVLPHGLPYLVDEVFCYQMDRKGDRFFQTAADRKHPAKDRSGNLHNPELKPNMKEIIERILK
jgi:energy-coupling factor transporter ATP-binding protein EcfA2